MTEQKAVYLDNKDCGNCVYKEILPQEMPCFKCAWNTGDHERNLVLWEGITTPQQRVYAAVCARGYRDGWTPEQFAARQVCKLGEELGEMAECVYQLPKLLQGNYRELGLYCRKAFDDKKAWEYTFIPTEEYDRIKHELSDIVVVALTLAQELSNITGQEFDVIQAAVDKSTADIERGVR